MKITVKQLRALGACEDQVDLFQRLLGDSVEVTEALCVGHAQEFGAGAWDWAAAHLLSPPARAAYEAARAPAWAEYDAATAPALATYEAARATAWATYKAAVARAFGGAAAA